MCVVTEARKAHHTPKLPPQDAKEELMRHEEGSEKEEVTLRTKFAPSLQKEHSIRRSSIKKVPSKTTSKKELQKKKSVRFAPDNVAAGTSGKKKDGCCPKAQDAKEELMRHEEGSEKEEVTLRTKYAPSLEQSTRRSSIKKPTLKKHPKKNKSVRFAPDNVLDATSNKKKDGGCCPKTAVISPEDYVLVTHDDDADHEEEASSVSVEVSPNPQEAAGPPSLSEVCCLLVPSSEMSPRDKANVWWRPEDYELFKGPQDAKEELMRHEEGSEKEEVTLRTKYAPSLQKEHSTRRSSIKKPTLKKELKKRKSVRFAPDNVADGTSGKKKDGCCPKAVDAEDFVLVTHRDSSSSDEEEVCVVEAQSNPQGNPQEATGASPRLSEVCCLLVPSSEMSPRDKANVWWRPEDYELFKGTARLIGAEIRRRTELTRVEGETQKGGAAGEAKARANAEQEQRGYAAVLSRALNASHSSLHDDDSSDSDSSSESSSSPSSPSYLRNPLPARLFAYLTHWVRVGHSRRGLERWSVGHHCDVRNGAREGAIKAVLGEQKRRREEENGEGKDAMVEEGIRAASRRATRSARLFALAIGQADAAAVGCSTSDPSLVEARKMK
eukprot:CAMPEP_0197468718 /NCGR_PEP_ID=MMETSP1175-20131217/66221_1 /TAXON_ID=1003142 /ORGANISM="Triceratium dubium, Strain CCMP147" /LENGTH=607 /DNA_ID=CAMNT_0043004831 /DNA_START=1005 /DNA_END=2829 /DNA_ORIENTATION=-